MERKVIPPVKFLVQIDIGKTTVRYYFREIKKAETFFNDYCNSHGITARFTLQAGHWSRIQVHGVTIDFETIKEIVFESMFDLQ